MYLQLLAHLWGDYVLQSHWMATRKTGNHGVAAVHALVYSVPFIVCGLAGWLSMSIWAWVAIVVTHAVIDRWRLARYVTWAKNHLAPRGAWPGPLTEGSGSGYGAEVPPWLAVWLLIIVDNTLHLTINALALELLS